MGTEHLVQMEMIDIIIPIVLFIAIAVVLCLYFYWRHRTSQSIQETVRTAIEQGQQLTPEILDRLGQAPRRAKSQNSDLRRGVILITIGLGIAAFVAWSGQFHTRTPLLPLAFGSLPVLLGIAYLGLWRFDKSG